MDDRPPIVPRSLVNSDAERGRSEIQIGESRTWELAAEGDLGWFEAGRIAYLRRRYPTQNVEQATLDSIWNQLVRAINRLNAHELSTLDTSGIGGVVPVHTTASRKIASRRALNDGSSQLLVSHRFLSAVNILSTLARFELSRPALWLVIRRFGAPEIAGASPGLHSSLARSAMVRDFLVQLNFHGIIASYRPRISPMSGLLFRAAVTFAMAHEAAHLLISDRDSLEAQSSEHLRSDGSIAESQWGPELAQDRLALRLTRYALAVPGVDGDYALRVKSKIVNDHVLSAAVISLIAVHVLERGYFVGEADSHPSALDRLGSLMFEFNPGNADGSKDHQATPDRGGHVS